MTALREAAQQVLDAIESDTVLFSAWTGKMIAARAALRAALAQQAEPTGKESLQVESVVAENATTQQQIEQTPPSEYRRGYWAGFAIGKREGRIEAEEELAQQAEPQDAELSAALGWPGGISEPVLDRKTLLRQVADLRSALAQQAEPVEPVAWVASEDGRVIYDDVSTNDVVLRVAGDFEDDEQRARYAQRIVDKLNVAPAQRKPLTEEEIEHIGLTHQSLRQVVRAVEKAVWEKNHE